MRDYEKSVQFCKEFEADYKNNYGQNGSFVVDSGLFIGADNQVFYGYTIQFDGCKLDVNEVDEVYDPNGCDGDEYLIATVAEAIGTDEDEVKARLEKIGLI